MNVRIAALAALLASSLAAPAGAHVTIAPAAIAGGGVAELTFRCPTERSGTATTAFILQLPRRPALRLVKARPVPGWHVAVTSRAGVVDTIAWSGGRIEPNAVQNFRILAGPLPHGPATLVFKALQRYADGEVVRWIEVRGKGEPEPAHPAPELIVR